MLSIQFCEKAAAVTCPDPVITDLLRRHLHYCSDHYSGRHLPVTAQYDLCWASGAWQLWRDAGRLCTADTPLSLLTFFMSDLLMHLITPIQRHLVFHAGGLALAGEGILLCGQTGRGKSTLTALLTAVGFDYLSDEVVAVPLALDRMAGFARSLVLKAGSAFVWQPRVNDDNRSQVQRLPDGVTWLTPDFLRPSSVCRQAPLRLLLFAQYSDLTLFTARSLSPAETAFQLMQHLVNARNLPAHGLTAVTALAKQSKAYAIIYSDVTAVADWMRSIC